jgi:hypothetical protein
MRLLCICEFFFLSPEIERQSPSNFQLINAQGKENTLPKIKYLYHVQCYCVPFNKINTRLHRKEWYVSRAINVNLKTIPAKATE